MRHQPTDGAAWHRHDTVLVVIITAVAGVVRAVSLRTPRGFVFDEFYAADACLFVRGAGAACRTASEIGVAHPPLAKWLIGGGIWLFGFDSRGWRVAPVVAGTLSVAVLYLLARRLLRSTIAAVVASSLLAVDLLHFVMSRTAMLDIFVVLFGLSAFLFVLYDADRSEAPASSRLERLLARRWLGAAGLTAGAATACKWSGGYLLVGVIVTAVLAAHLRRRTPVRETLRREGPVILMALVAVPAVVYVASFIGRVDGSIASWPWNEGSWWRAFAARQREMANSHLGDLPAHPYGSPAWSWPLVKRPVLFFFDGRGGTYREILAIGNPLVWVAGVATVVHACWRWLRHRAGALPAEAVVVIGFAAAYVPWFVVDRDTTYLYYFLPTVPFLCLGLALMLQHIASIRHRAAAIGAAGVIALGSFAFLFPVLTNRPLPYREWDRRMLVFDCTGDGTPTRHRPTTRPAPPPRGWCWV